MEILIVNLTTQSFFSYFMENDTDKGYNRKLMELLTPPRKQMNSHWSRNDKIVFCPTHLRTYVEKNYGKLYMK